jgi:predicted nucleotidyltransferase
MPEIERAIRETAIANGAQKAILFGSFARRTATSRSDLDVIFVERTSARFLDRLGRYFDALTDRLRLAVDVFVYTPQEYERMQGGFFMSRVAREGRVIYERGEA